MANFIVWVVWFAAAFACLASAVAVVSFRNDDVRNPGALIQFIAKNQIAWRIRPDSKVVVKGEWETPEQRLAAAEQILVELAKLAG